MLVPPAKLLTPTLPVIVTLLAVLSVVNVIPVPATNVNVAVLLAAVTLVCPDTAIVLYIFCELPKSVLVNVTAPVLLLTLMPVPATADVTADNVPPNVKLPLVENDPVNVNPLTVPVPLTDVTVPTPLPLNVVQSAALNTPLFNALAVGTFNVMTGVVVPFAMVLVRSVPVVPNVIAATLVTVP